MPPPREQDPPDAPTGARGESGRGGDQLAHRLKQVAKGDEAAFAAVYDETAPRLHGLVLRILRNPAQSEEVTQEVFLEVWRRASHFDPQRGSAIGWLLTMAHRRAVDRVRSSQASVVRDDGWHARSREVDFDTTAEHATARIEAARVRAALEGLTEVQREAVSLAYLGGYTHTEVAGLLDLPLGTAKTRIRDGLIRLRDQLGVTP
ncbi:ECF RNA polymerase sigma factor SigK [Janibacter sp. CX7]|uniref:ECF RNA polymerase sigma factor SigK n=1 Tax=Janibacter sp. CX7 TaxID=2963431 RepID=UPI0020CCDB80|nr:ECF RNA polymerase sigma factor SigK [Janibacter sp. CX7]